MKSKKTCRLEHYMEFLENPHSEELTISQLNQIIYMHGFKRLHHQPKKILLDTLNTMDFNLIDPSRSTLKESISSAAPLTIEDVVNDLDFLDWKECSLQSIHTINAGVVEEELGTTTNTCFLHQEDHVFGRGTGFKVSIGFPRTSTRKRNSRRKIKSVSALFFAPPRGASPLSRW